MDLVGLVRLIRIEGSVRYVFRYVVQNIGIYSCLVNFICARCSLDNKLPVGRPHERARRAVIEPNVK